MIPRPSLRGSIGWRLDLQPPDAPEILVVAADKRSFDAQGDRGDQGIRRAQAVAQGVALDQLHGQSGRRGRDREHRGEVRREEALDRSQFSGVTGAPIQLQAGDIGGCPPLDRELTDVALSRLDAAEEVDQDVGIQDQRRCPNLSSLAISASETFTLSVFIAVRIVRPEMGGGKRP